MVHSLGFSPTKSVENNKLLKKKTIKLGKIKTLKRVW